MTDAVDASPSPESVRDDLVERLKKELAEKTEAEARANARATLFEDKERARVAAWQGDAQYFMKEWIMEEAGDADAKADMAPLGTWADEYANKQWEETEEVTRTRKVKEAVTVCHKCWLIRLEEIREILEKDYEKWESNPSNHVSRIQVVAEICQSYGFEEESKRMRYLISIMKESANQ